MGKFKLQGEFDFQGLHIMVENRKGSVREGVSDDGKKWKTKMKFPYGYISRTKAADNEHVDCFVGDQRDSETVFVVHQVDPNTKKYDEDKVMLGFENAKAAKAAYLDHYDSPDFFGSMTEMTIERFKESLKENKGKKLKKSVMGNMDIINAQEVLGIGEFEKGHPTGYINKYGKQKQGDGTWKYVGKGKKESKEGSKKEPYSEESTVGDHGVKMIEYKGPKGTNIKVYSAKGTLLGESKDKKEAQRIFKEAQETAEKKETSGVNLVNAERRWSGQSKTERESALRNVYGTEWNKSGRGEAKRFDALPKETQQRLAEKYQRDSTKTAQTKDSSKKENVSISWRSEDYKKQITADYKGNSLTVGKNDEGWYLYLNNKKVASGEKSKEAVQKIAQENLSQREKKFSSFIGKTVEIYPGKKDKVLDFGGESELYVKHNLKKPANPMGYSKTDGSYFLVERNGEKIILNPGFGDSLIDKDITMKKANEDDIIKAHETLEMGEFEKGLPIGHINAHGKQKQSDGSWKYVGKGKKGSKEEGGDKKTKFLEGLKDRAKSAIDPEDAWMHMAPTAIKIPHIKELVDAGDVIYDEKKNRIRYATSSVEKIEKDTKDQPSLVELKRTQAAKNLGLTITDKGTDKKDTKGTEKKEEKSTDWNLYRARGGKTYQFTETGKGERRLIHLEATDGSHKINMTWDDESLAKKYADRFAFPMKSDPKALREAKIANAIAYDEAEGKLREAQAAYSAAAQNAGRKELKEAEREKLKEIEMDALQKVYDIDTIYRRVVRNRNKLSIFTQ